jgi:hypothetical protein
MTVVLLGAAVIVSAFAGILFTTELRFLHRKIQQMSASLDRLKTAVATVVAKVQTLEATPAGTPDAELDVLSAQLEAVAPATIPAPPPAAE